MNMIPKSFDPSEPAPAADMPAPDADAAGRTSTLDLVDSVDRHIWHVLARATHGASPIAISTAWYDWLAHIAISPGLRVQLTLEARAMAFEHWKQFWIQTGFTLPRSPEEFGALTEARLKFIQDAYDEWVNWLTRSTARPVGVSRVHAERTSFSLRQVLEAFHPRNFLLGNPEALRTTADEAGANLMRGLGYFVEDLSDAARLSPPGRDGEAASELGETLATTPGKVIYRNRLIELIQYEPATAQVKREPILITPAWIMKYYILDLSAQSSLVKYLVDSGFTVFMISWRNPGPDDRNLSFDDYRQLGVVAALDAIGSVLPGIAVHAVGYCLGGTLLSVAAAAIAREDEGRLASMTLLAAQTDFTEPGELAVYIDEAQLAALDADMESHGYLDGDQMAAAFALLRSRDLIWRRIQTEYLLGQRGEQIDLVKWNEDVTRMPYRMHSQYLRHFFLNNDFVQGRLTVDGQPVAVSDIRAPIFALGTTKDHVAPWRSVFKIHLFADTEVTFALTNGGHNAGVVSPPDHPHRTHWIHTRLDGDHYVDPDHWKGEAEEREGSWWPSWRDWLAGKSSGERKPKRIKRADIAGNEIGSGETLPAAPGQYVRETVPG